MSVSTRFFVDMPRQFADRTLFQFDHGETVSDLTGAILDEHLQRIGSHLQTSFPAQANVIVLLPQGLHFISALLACWQANLCAIPLPLTGDPARMEQHLQGVIADASAVCILTDSATCSLLAPRLALPLLDVEALLAQEQVPLPRRPVQDADGAILLYTSGSTGRPKGIILSHANLWHQASGALAQWDMSAASRVFSWMPQYHNFGLHLGVLAPLAAGASSILMAPARFAANPLAWLRGIHRFQASHSGAPDFALASCLAHLAAAVQEEVRLDSLQVLLCGGEPVQYGNATQFTRSFGDLGLNPAALCPHYGMSETGAIATRRQQDHGEPFLLLDRAALQQGTLRLSTQGACDESGDNLRRVAACGAPGPGIDCQVVDPASGQPCAPERIGEIRVRSVAHAQGYVNAPPAVDTGTGLANADGGHERFLSTGDLGFMLEGQLYVVGRLKEVLIIHGRNHDPADIEASVHSLFAGERMACMVFACDQEAGGGIVVLQEVPDGMGDDASRALCRRIVAAVSAQHGVEVSQVCLIAPGTILRSAVGKRLRRATREAFLAQLLLPLYAYQVRAIHAPDPGFPDHALPGEAAEHTALSQMLHTQVILPVLDLSPAHLQGIRALSELGVSSLEYIRMADAIEAVFRIRFEPTLFFKHHLLTELVQHIADAQRGVTTLAALDSNALPAKSDAAASEVAIVGMSCHFPGGATTPDLFWKNLQQGHDCITALPASRAALFARAEAADWANSAAFPQWGGFIADVAGFDAAFFGISPLEAESMDPQQRKLLELVWHVFEHALHDPLQMRGRPVGLFVGAHSSDYLDSIANRASLRDTYGAYLDSGVHMSLIANRVSRWFDFHGPSQVINTACSSSLVAMQQALNSLAGGECKLAIAAGINLILSPRIYCASQSAGMLAADGRCKTFDQQANGFVRAEGYGAVLLKPLADALRDGDTIYGVVKSAVVNHDGQSGSLRAPNMNAQKSLLLQAYEQAGVPLHTVTHIEAHGTGTPLGDPIEVQALREAFAQLDPDLPTGYCAIGSVKTHIGHCESAAGMAGVIKVLLSMQHGELPALLHFHQPNRYLDLHQSPFFLLQQKQAWQRQTARTGEVERAVPRRAGVSSFGFGGSNAHVVLEEFITDKSPAPAGQTGPQVIVLSAHDAPALQRQVQQLLDLLASAGPELTDLASLAWSLQSGRAALAQRLALVVQSVAVLYVRLQAFLQQQEGLPLVFAGRVEAGAAAVTASEPAAAANDMPVRWAQAWARGEPVSWAALHSAGLPPRMQLPLYPFDKKSYWIAEAGVTASPGAKQPALHPLVQQNTSDLTQQRYRSCFDGSEPFLADHRVQGLAVMPGVAFLEMARAAILLASGADMASMNALSLHHITWLRPLTPGAAGRRLDLILRPQENGDIGFEMLAGDPAEPVLYCQGRGRIESTVPVPVQDLQQLQQQFGAGHWSGPECYARYARLGIDYGPAMQAVAEIFLGQGKVLARLELAGLWQQQAQPEAWGLHPGLLDAALHASLALFPSNEDGRVRMPFALDHLQIHAPCHRRMWSILSFNDPAVVRGETCKLDMDLLDERGQLCVRLRGLLLRSSDAVVPAAKAKANGNAPACATMPAPTTGHMALLPLWNQVAMPRPEGRADPAQRVLLVGVPAALHRQLRRSYPLSQALAVAPGAGQDAIAACLEQDGPIDHIVWLLPGGRSGAGDGNVGDDEDDVLAAQSQGVMHGFRMIKALLQAGYDQRPLEWTVLTRQVLAPDGSGEIHPHHAGVHGLLGAMAKELPQWRLRLLDGEADLASWPMLAELMHWSPDPDGEPRLLRAGQCFRQQLVPARLPAILPASLPASPPLSTPLSRPADPTESHAACYRQGGVYVVIGGAGGIGATWSESMIRAHQAHIVWIGRRPLDAAIQAKIDALARFGPAPRYIQADAADPVALQQALAQILAWHSALHGVVHAAIVLHDNALHNMDEARFAGTLAAKVDVSVHMARVFGTQALDFMLFFSSMQSFSRAAGQSNYAAGCTFKDAFALALQRRVSYPVRIINWGYWGDVGVVASEPYRKRMAQLGWGSIDAPQGMAALATLLSGGSSRIGFVNALRPVPGGAQAESVEVYPAHAPSMLGRLASRYSPSIAN